MSASFYFPLADAVLISAFGRSVQYSRPESSLFSGIPPFSVSGVLNTDGQYADPMGAIYGALFVVAADIPGNPQKGDLVLIDRTYIVKEVFYDAGEGWARLMLRYSGQ